MGDSGLSGATKTMPEAQPIRSLLQQHEYESMYNQSIKDPDHFWGAMAQSELHWIRKPDSVLTGSLDNGDVSWFAGGKLNACYNCVDRHAAKDPDRVAIIAEADEPGQSRRITYAQLLSEVSQAALALRALGVQKGDTVAVYMPMIAEALICLLAIARIGAIHCVVFAGFSADSLADRVIDAEAKVVVTTDQARRGGKVVFTKAIVDKALERCPAVHSVLVFQRTGETVNWVPGRDLWWHDELPKQSQYVDPETMDAEDPLFLLYTSGSTGKPKGLVHTTAGYLLGCATTARYVFDLGRKPDDVYFCTGDIGWITGHSYVLYAPLLLGVPTLVFEGTPAYPDYSRFWQIAEQYKVTHFYTAPTALRLLKAAGVDHVTKHDLQHLRVLGSVGEPIAPDVWTWYYETIGGARAAVIDTYWQTETGAHIIAPLANVSPVKPGSASVPFFGIEPAILDSTTGQERVGPGVEGVLAIKKPWPSMARSIWKDHARYISTYLKVYDGYYFTGDGAARDDDNLYWIKGRVDDVVNVSGHRLSTAEIEAALISCSEVAEAAVVGINDELTGQAVYAFVSLNTSGSGSRVDLAKSFIMAVRQSIGPFAAPKKVFVVDDLPKTRSGKIMRRVLRKILMGEIDSLGDVSTLSDPSVVERIAAAVG